MSVFGSRSQVSKLNQKIGRDPTKKARIFIERRKNFEVGCTEFRRY